MFVYNKQKSRRDKELKSQSVESAILKQVEIDASKIQRVKTSRNIESKNTESKIIIETRNRNVNEIIKFYWKSNEYNTEIKNYSESKR